MMDRIVWRIFGWLWRFFLVTVILTVIQVALLRFVNPPFTATSAWRWFRDGSSGQSERLSETWCPLDVISPYVRRAVLAGEDQRFLAHHGFDFIELNHAFQQLFRSGSLRGASTISMQTARTVFLWRGRGWLRKAIEAYYTLLIESFWRKERIFEIYLNTVDWGDDIMGIEAASRRYFRRSCAGITRNQASLLAAILPNPHRWSPVRPTARVLLNSKRILKDMAKMPLL
jgi:monofunctional biosynthetic peptidoglycan transglycosylase